jgi:hypothetical protein
VKQKILVGLGAAGTAIAGLFTAFSAHAQMTTSTLGTSIDSVNSTTTSYFQVLLDKYWPFLVGFIILVTVWHFGKRILSAFS